MDKTSNVTFSIKNFEISTQRVTDLMVTALEVGSVYWVKSLSTIKVAPRPNDGTNFPWYAYAKIYEDPELEFIITTRDGEKVVFRRESIQKGLNLLHEKYSQYFNEIVNDGYFSDTADFFLQACLFEDAIMAERLEGPSDNPLELICNVAVKHGIQDKLLETFFSRSFNGRDSFNDILARNTNIVVYKYKNLYDKNKSKWFAVKYNNGDWIGDKYFAQQYVERRDGTVFIVEATPEDGVVINDEKGQASAYIVKYAYPSLPEQVRARFIIPKNIMESDEYDMLYTYTLMYKTASQIFLS
jgi:hypothetical protein